MEKIDTPLCFDCKHHNPIHDGWSACAQSTDKPTFHPEALSTHTLEWPQRYDLHAVHRCTGFEERE